MGGECLALQFEIILRANMAPLVRFGAKDALIVTYYGAFLS